MLLRVVFEIVRGRETPIRAGAMIFMFGSIALECQLEADLVVSFARCAMAHGIGVLFTGDLNMPFCV